MINEIINLKKNKKEIFNKLIQNIKTNNQT